MITEKQKDILKHTLGLDRSKDCYRNSFVASEGHDDWDDLIALEKMGFMARLPVSLMCQDPIFYVTPSGKFQLPKFEER